MRKRRKYIKQDLRGHDFSGQNLRGVRFVECDLRGANFEAANLRGTRFNACNLESATLQKARLGTKFTASIEKNVLIFLFSGFTTFLALAFNASMVEVFVLSDNSIEQVGGAIGISISILFLFLFFRRGLSTVVVALAVAGAFAFVVAFVVAVAGAFAVAGAVALAVAGAVALALAFAGAVAGAVALAGAVAGAVAVAGAGAFAVVFAFAGDVVTYSLLYGFIFQVGISVITWQQMRREDKRSAPLFALRAWWGSRWGTCFINANLTGADFRQTAMGGADLHSATLDRVRWEDATKLLYARFPRRYSESLWLKPLLVSCASPNQMYDARDLSKLNLVNADLSGTSFVDANLNQCDLRGADLTGANLTRAQLESSDLRGATLTGAYIEDWNITRSTLLDGVICDYIYMHDPSQADATELRKPDDHNQTFAPGDFADFIKPLYDTLDLFHSQDVDTRAVVVSINQLQADYPEAELEIVSIERRGDAGIVTRLNVAPEADKSELSASYHQIYQKIAVLETHVKGQERLIVDKDRTIFRQQNTIDRQQNMLDTFIQSSATQKPTNIYNVSGDARIANDRSVIADGDVGGTIVSGNENLIGDENSVTQEGS